MAAIDPLGHARTMDGGRFTFFEEVGKVRLWIHRRGWHSLDSASSALFLLLMVTSFSMKIGLKAQNATQISRAQLPTLFSFFLWSQALQRK